MKSKSSTVIVVAASIVFISILLLTIISYHNIGKNSDHLESLSRERLEKSLIFTMRDAIIHRALFLSRMLESEDPFERDSFNLQYHQQAERFMLARDEFVTISEHNKQMWINIRDSINRNYYLQNQIASLILDDKEEQAKKLIISKLFRYQVTVLNSLTNILQKEEKEVDKLLEDANIKNLEIQKYVTGFGLLIILIGIVITRFAVKLITQSERNVTSQANRIRTLYEITSMPISLNEQIDKMLEMETFVLGMEIGKVTCVDKIKNESIFEHVYSKSDLYIQKNQKVDFDKTFCKIVFDLAEPLSIDQTSKSIYHSSPCFQYSRQESYLGQRIWVKGKLYGTLSFSSSKPRKIPFSSTDKDLIKLMASWVSVTLERQLVAEEMREAKVIAEQANSEKSRFLANMSHEIRTPLTAIIGFTESLRDQNHTSEEREQWTNSIIRNGHHLHQIINDILDLSKIEAGQLNVETFNVSPYQILEEVKTLVSGQAKEKNIRFDFNVTLPFPKTIETDPTRLKQILLNLCTNGIKFTREGEVLISAKCVPERNILVIEVSDTGIGMDAAELQRIFKPFSQADTSTTRKYGGTGLGLTISQQLAQKLGGSLICRSNKYIGSQFVVTISTGPLDDTNLCDSKSQLQSAETKLVQKEEFHKLSGKVLLAEDNKDNQSLISLIVKRFGLSIDVVDNGQLAVESAVSSHFDLILMDMQMPVMGGVEAITWLRQMGVITPIVALTANALASDKQACLDAGAEEYATKPIDVNNFYQIISKYLEKQDEKVETVGDDKFDEDFDNLKNKFIDNLPDMLEDLQSACENLQWDAIQSVSHVLKGMGGSFGHPEITTLSEKLNNDARDKLTDNIDNELHELKQACHSIIEKYNNNSRSA